MLDRAAHIVARARGRPDDDDRRRGRQARQDRPGRGPALRRHPHLLRGRGPEADRRDGPDGGRRRRRGQARVRAARALRRGRRDQPLQLPAQPRRPQARPLDRRRQRDRSEARGPDPDLRDQARRDPLRGRPARELAARDHRLRLRGRQRDRRERPRSARSPSPARRPSAGRSAPRPPARRSTSSSARPRR